MNDALLRQQPRDVRDEFERIDDAEFDHDGQITSLKLKLGAAQSKLRSANQKHDQIRSILGRLQGDIDEAQREIQNIDAQRAEAIASALIEETNFAADEKLIARRSDLQLKAERLLLAHPALESRQRAQAREVAVASSPCVAIEEQIGARRGALKLLEARRRHGYA